MTPPEAAPRVGDENDPLPPAPGPAEYIVDGPRDIAIPGFGEGQQKIYVDGVGASIITERIEYLDENGRLITESLRDFPRKALTRHSASLDDFLKRWQSAK